MKKYIFAFYFILAANTLTGCTFHNPADANNDLQKHLDEIDKNNHELLDNPEQRFQSGGQPGAIKVSGVIVDQNAKLDARITVLAKTGTGKDGTSPVIAKYLIPILTSAVGDTNLSFAENDQSLIAIGCEKNIVDATIAEKSLILQNLPTPTTKNLMNIQAHTVMLCGKLEALENYTMLAVKSDELILSGLDYLRTDFTGWLELSANKLNLLGANKIEMLGLDTSITLPLNLSITLTVVKEISSNQTGNLSLLSFGSNFNEQAK